MAELAVTKTPEAGLFPKRLYNWGFPASPFQTGLFGMNPFATMRDLTREMDRMFAGTEAAPWWPAIECKKTDGALMITADLPGMKKEDVKVEITNGALVLEGERKLETKKEEEGFFQTERSYGKFYRSIPLPEGFKAEEIKAELSNGVLEVKVPVAEPKAKMKAIPIEEKKAEAKK